MPSLSQIPPEILIEWVWGRTQKFAVLTNPLAYSGAGLLKNKLQKKKKNPAISFSFLSLLVKWLAHGVNLFIHSVSQSFFLSSTYYVPPSLIFHF